MGMTACIRGAAGALAVMALFGTGAVASAADGGAAGTPAATATPSCDADGDGRTTIEEVQGTGDASPCVGGTVSVQGVVTAAYPDGGFNGFVIQTPGTGADAGSGTHRASDAVFVYSATGARQVSIGDGVQVSGRVDEYYGLTEIKASAVTRLGGSFAPPVPARVSYPDADAGREALESMLIDPQGPYTVSDVYNANRYGEIGLAASDRPFLNPTVRGLKGDPATGAAYQAETDRIARQGVYLDDGSSRDFLDSRHPENADVPLPYLSNDAPVRVGERVTFTRPVILDYRNDG